MQYRSYHKEIQKNTAQVLDVFSGIYIDRRNTKDVVQQLIKVPCLYGSRSRILKSLENRADNLTLPLVCLSINGVSRESGRLMDIHSGLGLQHGTYDLKKNTGVPINITYSLDIFAKYQEDMDQIIANFIPFFNPDIYVVVPHPNSLTLNLKSQLVWDGNFALSYPNELDKNSPARVSATTTLVLHGWVFPGMENEYPTTSGYIETVSASFHAVPQPMTFDEYKANYLSGLLSGGFYDILTITG